MKTSRPHPYIAILKTRFRARLQYRAAAFAGVVTQFFWGFIRIMILEAFYLSGSGIGAESLPLSFEQAVVYVWLGQAFLGLLPWNTDPDVDKMIREGSVAYEMLRPLDLYNLWFIRIIAWRTANTLLRCVPLLLVAFFVLPIIGLTSWSLSLPPTSVAGISFAISMILAVFLGAAFSTLMQSIMFWTVSGQGLRQIMGPLIMIGSGMIIPLPLFPDWAQPILRALPFHAMVDAPYRIYSGNIIGTELLLIFVQQMVWIVGLVFAGKRLMSIGKKRLVVQGG